MRAFFKYILRLALAGLLSLMVFSCSNGGNQVCCDAAQ